MIQFDVSFKNRDFVGQFFPAQVKANVVSMRWNAVGGCDEAVIELRGPVAALWAAIDYLRCGVEITDPRGVMPWWGYVHEVTVGIGQWAIGASLDRMFNKIAVAYSLAQTDRRTIGYRKTTAWSTDTDSSDEYGIKEFLSSQGSLSDDAATARQAELLNRFKYPVGTCSTFGGGAVATLVCLGWYHTLSWRYAVVDPVPAISYESTGAAGVSLGYSASYTKVMQAINIGGRASSALGLQIYARKVNSPTDNLVLGLYQLDDNTDAPRGSAVGTITLAGSGISASYEWIGGTFASEAQIDPTKDYGLVASRSGAVDSTNFYSVNVNEALGDASGFLRIWNGSAWVARSPDADMPYIISKNNSVESTNQIRELAQTFGEFITAIDIDEASGIMLPSYRDGDTLVSDELTALYASGGANGRRLLANVTPDRRLAIWEMPARTSITHDLDHNMVFYANGTYALPPYQPPVGVWCRLVDLIPGGVDAAKLNHPEVQFVEAVTWDARSGLHPEFLGTPSPDDMFRVER